MESDNEFLGEQIEMRDDSENQSQLIQEDKRIDSAS